MEFIEVFANPNAWIAILTLTFLEIVLGNDNIVFISIVSNKLKESQRPKARNIGLLLTMLFRVLLPFWNLMGIKPAESDYSHSLERVRSRNYRPKYYYNIRRPLFII